MALLTLSPPVAVAVTAGKLLSVSASLTLAGTDGKTLTVSNSLALAGTDGTTMTFPATSTVVAGLSIGNVFSVPQAITTATTGAALTITTTAQAQFDAGTLLINMNTPGYNNPILWVATNFAYTSGWFIYCANNGTPKFQVLPDGSTTVAGQFSAGGSLQFTSAGFLSINRTAVGSVSGAAVIGKVPAGQTSTAQNGWWSVKIGAQGYRIPVWLDS